VKKRAPGIVKIWMVVLVLTGHAVADVTNDWETYRGAWFTVQYPSAFQVKPSMKSRTAAKGYDSAFFIAPGGEVEFYVFSPQWHGEPQDLALNPAIEEYTAQKEERRGTKRIRRVTIRAKDKSYWRSYVDTVDTGLNTRLVYGIKYRDQQAYDDHRDMYLNFVKSLRQYAD